METEISGAAAAQFMNLYIASYGNYIEWGNGFYGFLNSGGYGYSVGAGVSPISISKTREYVHVMNNDVLSIHHVCVCY